MKMSSYCKLRERGLDRSDIFFAIVMPLLAIGPTIVPAVGLRSEHVSILIFAIVALFRGQFRSLTAVSWCCLGVAFAFFLSAFFADLFPSFILLKEEVNVLKFFIVFTPLCYLFSRLSRASRVRYFSTALWGYFVAVSLNFILQIANMMGYAVDIAAFFAGDGESVSWLWRACYGQGRYIGVFAQPANQGLFTGLFLLSAAWIWERRSWKWIVFAIASLSIFLGTSKVGLIGILITGMFLLRRNPIHIIPIAIAVFFTGFFLDWVQGRGESGLELQFFDSGKELTFETLTAGRIGEGSTLFYAISCVWENGPFWGLGAGELARLFDMPYDNDFVYVYANGGILALLAEIGIFVAILGFAKGRVKWEGYLLLVFLCVSSLGIVIFSGNGNIFLLSLMLALLHAESNDKEGVDYSLNTSLSRANVPAKR